MTQLPVKDQRRPWLRYEVEGYTDEIVQDFKQRLAGIFSRRIHRVQGQVVFTSHVWRRLFKIRWPLVRELMLEFFSTCRFADTLLDLEYAVVGELTKIDLDELFRLHICKRVADTWAWAAPRPERQQAAAAEALEVIEATTRTMPQRMTSLEEEVLGLRESLGEQRAVLDAMSQDFSRGSLGEGLMMSAPQQPDP
nr:hypothetical protein [Tanacetum cinerariifolium]